MTTLFDLQASVQDPEGFKSLDEYLSFALEFLQVLGGLAPTRIISPSKNQHIFYQYPQAFQNKISRPLNSQLFFEDERELRRAYDGAMEILNAVRSPPTRGLNSPGLQEAVSQNLLNRTIYSLQQSIGTVGDSFENSNQTRKRIGQLFENLVKLLLNEIGLQCQPRTINLPIPGFPGMTMSYELDLVFSKERVVVAAESGFIHHSEIVGSVKTTSKDRIDKIFLDKFLLTRLLGRDVPVVAVFLHDVQRARRGTSIFGVNSTFKTNHFLGYTVALNRLDGVYYVDPRPDMIVNPLLRAQIRDFQHLVTEDIWILSAR